MNNYMTVTTKNIDAVAGRLRALLANKRYTTVHVYEYKRWEPEVRLHQKLEGSISHAPAGDGSHISVHHHSDSHAQLIICDTYGVGGLATTQTADGYDRHFNAPHIVFEYSQARITQRASNGMLFYVVYAVEGDLNGSQD